MKQVRIRFKEEYNECPEELVILVVPDNTTNKSVVWDSSNSNIYILQDLIKKVLPVLKEPVNFLSVCYLGIHEYDKNQFLEQQAINGSPVKPVLNRIS